jgi:type IV secretion system protein VirB3
VDRNAGLIADPLFIGATRPPMRWGITYSALLLNGMVTLEAFLITKNLLWLSIWIPIHFVCYALCLHDARFFDLLFIWVRTRGPGWMANVPLWKANTYSPLRLDLPNDKGVRRDIPTAYVG